RGDVGVLRFPRREVDARDTLAVTDEQLLRRLEGERSPLGVRTRSIGEDVEPARRARLDLGSDVREQLVRLGDARRGARRGRGARELGGGERADGVAEGDPRLDLRDARVLERLAAPARRRAPAVDLLDPGSAAFAAQRA